MGGRCDRTGSACIGVTAVDRALSLNTLRCAVGSFPLAACIVSLAVLRMSLAVRRARCLCAGKLARALCTKKLLHAD